MCQKEISRKSNYFKKHTSDKIGDRTKLIIKGIYISKDIFKDNFKNLKTITQFRK